MFGLPGAQQPGFSVLHVFAHVSAFLSFFLGLLLLEGLDSFLPDHGLTVIESLLLWLFSCFLDVLVEVLDLCFELFDAILLDLDLLDLFIDEGLLGLLPSVHLPVDSVELVAGLDVESVVEWVMLLSQVYDLLN